MSSSLDRRAYAELSTSAVSAGEEFAYWREMICATFVRLAAEPVATGRFSGRIEHIPAGRCRACRVVRDSIGPSGRQCWWRSRCRRGGG